MTNFRNTNYKFKTEDLEDYKPHQRTTNAQNFQEISRSDRNEANPLAFGRDCNFTKSEPANYSNTTLNCFVTKSKIAPKQDGYFNKN